MWVFAEAFTSRTREGYDGDVVLLAWSDVDSDRLWPRRGTLAPRGLSLWPLIYGNLGSVPTCTVSLPLLWSGLFVERGGRGLSPDLPGLAECSDGAASGGRPVSVPMLTAGVGRSGFRPPRLWTRISVDLHAPPVLCNNEKKSAAGHALLVRYQ